MNKQINKYNMQIYNFVSSNIFIPDVSALSSISAESSSNFYSGFIIVKKNMNYLIDLDTRI